MRADLERVCASLEALGDVVAVVEADEVVYRSGAARGPSPKDRPELRGEELGPLAEGERRPLRSPSGRAWELRELAVEGARVMVARDVDEAVRLRERMERSDQILSLASHELKGPLHVLGMVCHLMESRVARGEAIEAVTLERIRRQVTRLDRLINQLLDLSRLQEDRLKLVLREGVEIASLVRDAVGGVDPARAADVRLELSCEPRLRADPDRFAEIVHQLLDNAVRFTRPGTAIRVALDEEPDFFRLIVADEGEGVPPNEVAHLFAREACQPRTRAGQGLGLGLYIAASLLRLHGATIAHRPTNAAPPSSTTSAPARGATFEIRLPRGG